MRRLHIGIALAAALSAAAITTTSDASLLNLTQAEPDVTSGFIYVEFDANTGMFTAEGFALSLNDGMDDTNITDGSFSLSAQINAFGMATGGSLTIGGNVLGFGPTLLTGSLTAFGFMPGGGNLFEFIFELDGGDLATPALYGLPGEASIGVILSAENSGFNGDWTQSFDNASGIPGVGFGLADTFAIVPGPAALPAFLLAGFLSRRRRREQ